MGHVYVCEAGAFGSLVLPESFTDRGREADAEPLNIEVLAALVAAMQAQSHVLDKKE